MGRIATNTNQQLQILQDRGMNIDLGKAKAKEILHDIGYYRLGFYWHPFVVDEEHRFREGTSLSSVVTLYYFDVDLRNLILKYVNRVEINFRTNVIYYVSNKFKDSPTWFVDPMVVHSDYIRQFGEHYNDRFKKDHKAIKNHHKKYINDTYAPAWKTLEYFTFGSMLKLFGALRDEQIQVRISEKFGIKNINKFKNLVGTLVYLRNASAHGDVIFDLNLPKGISAIPNIDFVNNNRHSIDSALKILSFFLKSISSNRNDDFMSELLNLIRETSRSPDLKNILEEKMGVDPMSLS